jgi:hypothetical protein
VPAGLIQMSNGAQAVAYLDRDFVLGPEAGHVNISGISGPGHQDVVCDVPHPGPAAERARKDEIAVILLNVKYDDLLRIHEPRALSAGGREGVAAAGLGARAVASGSRPLPAALNGKQTQTTGTAELLRRPAAPAA